MAEWRRSELSDDSDDSDDSDGAVDISDWTNRQDSDSHKKRSDIITAIIFNCKIRGNQSRDHLRTILESGWEVNEMLDIHNYFNYKNVHRTALHEAAYWRWTEGVKMLLDAGAKCTSVDTLETPLALAIQTQNCPPDLIKLLLKYGADPNNHNDQFENIPLLNAIENHRYGQNDTIVVMCLLEHGANPNVTHRVNIVEHGEAKWVHRSALHEAASQGWTEGVKMLLAAGAKCVTSDILENPLVLALEDCECPPDLIKLLLTHGADPNDHDDQLENIPLLNAIKHCSYRKNDTVIVQLLLDAGAKCNSFCASQNPLMLALENHRLDLIEILLKHGVHVNCTVVEVEPLLHSLSTYNYRHPMFLQKQLDLFFLHGGNINVEDGEHRTALGYAVNVGHSNSVRWLIRHGADASHIRFTWLIEYFMPFSGSTWHFPFTQYFPETPLILLQSGMRVPHGALKQLSNTETTISTWLQDDMEGESGLVDQLESAECEEHQRVQCKLKKSIFPEYWPQQMADLQEFSDETLQVYPEDTCLTSTGDTKQEYQNMLDQIHRVLAFLRQPQSLQWYCRRCVRENLVSLQPSVVKTLPGPSRLKRYILCHEI